MTNSAQQKLGYRDIVFNVKTNKFYEHKPGDNYKELDINLDGGDDSGAAATTTSNVALEDVSTLSISDPGGLTTQKDLNHYFAENIVTKTSELENDAGFITADEVPDGGDVNLDGYAQLAGATFTGDVTAPYFIGDGSQLTNLPQPTIDYTRSAIGEPPSTVWLHIKNIRGGDLRLTFRSASIIAVHALYQGAAIPWARDTQDMRHYGNSLFLAGWSHISDSDSSPLHYGDASHYTRNGGDPDNDAARALITEWGFDPDNFCGMIDSDDDWITLSSTIEIDGQEAPNTIEYIVYIDDRTNPAGHHWYETNGTFEIGEYTFTGNKTDWKEFFAQQSYVPNVQNLDTSNGTNFYMFFYQANLSGTLGIGALDVGKGENFEHCFNQAKDFDANLSNWDMSSATTVKEMFRQCRVFTCNRRSIKDTGLDNWNLENVTDVREFIYQCESFEHDMSSVRMPNISAFPNPYNNKCPLRMSNGDITDNDSDSSRNNEPWTASTSRPYTLYWSATRFTKNPVLGATGALDTERKKLYQEYIDWVDAKVEAEEWVSWEKQYPEGQNNSAGKQEGIDKAIEVLAADAQLVIDYEP